MAVYKFRVSFEDYDDIVREIEVRSNQSFADFHRAIHQAIGFDGNAPSSFYMSNDYWHKGKEITLRKEQQKNEKIALMEDALLKNFIVDPHQKIYYIFNFDKPWSFQIQLVKIAINEDPKATYPQMVKAIGEAPKQFGNIPIIGAVENDDLDFLNELEYSEEEDETDEMGFDDGGVAADEEEETESPDKDEFDNAEEEI
jgi:hypothetical protein